MNKTIITVAACLIAVFSSFMWVYSKTLQRSADDLVKIKAKDRSDFEQGKQCKDSGGVPHYYDTGVYYYCDFAEKH